MGKEFQIACEETGRRMNNVGGYIGGLLYGKKAPTATTALNQISRKQHKPKAWYCKICNTKLLVKNLGQGMKDYYCPKCKSNKLEIYQK